MILSAYKLLNLITFFTVAGSQGHQPKQVQAWPLKKGAKVIEAANLIHSDFAKHFIKAEVANWQDLVKAGSWARLKEAGLVRLSGRDEEVSDGSVIYILAGA